jgi:Na+-translocating ferredoxin:NAD+ oxidoreductase subunit B
VTVDAFTAIKARLASHRSTAPAAPELDEILHILFTSRDAELVQHLNFDLEPADAIAARTGKPCSEVGTHCEELTSKGVIRAQTKGGIRRYAMLPLMPGLWEYPLMLGPREGLDFDRLSRLWEQYYVRAWRRDIFSQATMKVLPVNIAIDDESSVLPFERVLDYVEQASVIAVGNCACRIMAGKCDAPRETCFYLNGHGTFVLEIGAGRQVDKAEALSILRQTEEAGLVHVAGSSKSTICNCCRCCCALLRSRVAAVGLVPVSAYTSRVELDECIGCGACVDRCPTSSIAVDSVAVVDARRCFGCGLCATACPTGALKIVRRVDDTQPRAG